MSRPKRFNNERFRDTLIARQHRAFCRGRGALHLRVGPQLSGPIISNWRSSRAIWNVPRILALTATATPKVAKSICAGFEIEDDAPRSTPDFTGTT